MQSPRIQICPNGPEFSRIALGMWRLLSWNLTPEKCLGFVQQTLDMGITTIDHADIYQSETPFGEAMALAPSLRQRMEIVTKCGILLAPPDRSAIRGPHYNTGKDHIVASAENSLTRLRTDYIDVLLIHRPDPLMHADEIAEAFTALRKAGKVRYFGASNFTPSQYELLNSRCELVTNQVELSPFFLAPLHDGTLDQCQRLRVAPMIWSALAGGRLFSEVSDRAERVRSVLHELAGIYQVSGTTLVYSWLLRHPSHPVVLTGSGKLDVAQQAVAATNVELTREHWFALWSAAMGTDVP